MKIFVSVFALAVAIAATGPTFAEDAVTAKASCDKAAGAWNAQSNKCEEDSAKMGKGEGTQHPQATPENDTSKIDQPERRNPTTGN